MKLVIAALLTLALAGTAVAAKTTQPAPAKTAIKVKFSPGNSMF